MRNRKVGLGVGDLGLKVTRFEDRDALGGRGGDNSLLLTGLLARDKSGHTEHARNLKGQFSRIFGSIGTDTTCLIRRSVRDG